MVIEEELHIAADQPSRHPAKAAKNIAREIDRNRVHPHPHKRLAPGAALPYIHNEVEDPEQDGAVPARDQHVRRGPDLLDDGELGIPQPAQGDGANAERNEPEHFLLVRDRVATQEQPCEHAKQAGRHRRDRAQQSFRVKECVVLAARQILEINVVGQVQALVELAGDAVRGPIEQLLRCRPGRAVFGRRGITFLFEQLRGLRVSCLLCKLGEVALRQLNIAHRHKRHERPVTR